MTYFWKVLLQLRRFTLVHKNIISPYKCDHIWRIFATWVKPYLKVI